jgi:hypothetical protein
MPLMIKTKPIAVLVLLCALALLLWLPADWDSVGHLHEKLFGFAVPPEATDLKLVVDPGLFDEWRNDTRIIEYKLDPPALDAYRRLIRQDYSAWRTFDDDGFFGSRISFTKEQMKSLLVSRNHKGHQYRALVADISSGTIYAASYSTGR